MLLGGLWHGAGWTFVVWGGLHGCYLIVNHAWNRVRRYLGIGKSGNSRLGKSLAWVMTFLAVVIGWVFFRATDFDSAIRMLSGMAGINGFGIPNAILSRLGDLGVQLQALGVQPYLGGGSVFVLTYLWVFGLMIIALFFPNTQQFMVHYDPALVLYKHGESSDYGIDMKLPISWRPTRVWAFTIALIATAGVLALTSVSEFLYFQF